MTSNESIKQHELKRKIAMDLYHNKIVQFGQFTLRSGQLSEIYFDLRRLITNPILLSQIVDLYINTYQINPTIHSVCAVPYAAVPMATVYSQHTGCKMIMLRKEKKEYGTKKMIEGDYQTNDQIILLDDVISTGGSLIESINELEKAKLVINQIIVLIDRRTIEERTDPNITINKYPLNSIFKMEELLNILVEQMVPVPRKLLFPNKLTWNARQQLTDNLVVKNLLSIIDKKQTNLVFSADLTTTNELLSLVDLIGSEICLLKTHIDLLTDFKYDTVIPALLHLAKKHNFLILEDRKFADIGNTVQQQYHDGLYRISSWADLVTCHSITGEGLIKSLNESMKNYNDSQKKFNSQPRGLLLIAQLSNEGNLIDSTYKQRTCDLANKYPQIVAGVICQEKLLNNKYLHLTPGVNLSKDSDNLDQLYNTPQYVINQAQSDLIIVGRGIYQSSNPLQSAKEFRQQAWTAYCNRITL